MGYLNLYDTLDNLRKMGKNVFTLKDFSEVTGEPLPYVSRLLSGNKKVGRLERGKFYFLGTDIYEIA